MTNKSRNNTIEMIPVNEVYIPNPRVRNKKQYREIAENVVQVVPYAKALLAGTPTERLIETKKPRKIKGIDEEQMARMQSEMLSLQNEYRVIEDSLGSSVLNFTVAKGYVSKLMDNAKVVRYMAQNYSEILEEFQKITEMQSINPKEEMEEETV